MTRRRPITLLIGGAFALLVCAACDENPEVPPEDDPVEACAAEGQRCGPPRCVGQSALSFVCRADGDGLVCRAEASLCAGECRDGVCLPAGERCPEPGEGCAEAVCDGDAVVVGLCDGDFLCQPIRTPCEAGSVCRDGQCVIESPACAAAGDPCGESVCGGISDGIVIESVCDDDLACVERQRVCPSDAFCEGGRCVQEGILECEAAGQACPPTPFCEGNTAVSGTCQAPGLCAAERVGCGDALCRDGVCVPDIECPAAGALCAPSFCEGDSVVTGFCDDALRCRPQAVPCGDGFTCNGGVCAPVSPFICNERGEVCGAARCEGATVVEQRCDANLNCAEVRSACPENAQCLDGACVLEGECEQARTVCGDPRCEGNTAVGAFCDNLLRCVEFRTACGAQRCVDGLCLGGQCQAAGDLCGAPVCAGDAVATGICDDDLRCVEQIAPCAGDQLCRDGNCFDRPVSPDACAAEGQPCGVPACVGPANSVSEPVCDGDLVCVDAVRPCPRDAFCEGGRCVREGIVECAAPGDACAPEPVCEGNVAVAGVCSAPGLCVTRRFDCGDGICQGGRCVDDVECPAAGAVCAPTFCEGDVRVTGVCDDALRCRPEALPCPDDFTCNGGLCQPVSPFVCNARGEECAPPRCEGDALVETRRACLGGACVEGVCELGECERPGLACGPAICEGNAAVSRFCDNRLRCVESRQACAPGICEGGFCPLQARCEGDGDCAASACDGNAVVTGVCDDEGLCDEIITPCGPEGLCQRGICFDAPVSPDACEEEGQACGLPTCADAGEIVEQALCDADLVCVDQQRVCPLDTVCEDGQCVFQLSDCEAPFAACSERTCEGNVAVSGFCDADLLCVERRLNCGADAACVAGICLPLDAPGACEVRGSVCVPTVCEGNTRVTGICDAEGQCIPQRFPCAADQICDGGLCFQETPPNDCARRGNPCGETSCRFGQLVSPVCDENLVCVEDVRPCPDDGVCQDGQCIVADADCARALDICIPGRCDGNVAIGGFCDNALRCNVQRRDCGDGDCQLGLCIVGPECQPGTVCADPRCDGDARVTGLCSANGVCEDVRTPCGEGLVCDGGVCRAVSPDDCQNPGDRCGASICDGNTVIDFSCDADLNCTQLADPCPPGAVCDGGACRDPQPGECPAPGAPCGAAICDGNTVIRFSCDNALACAQLADPCPADTICDGGVCREPEPGECAEAGAACGEVFCDGNTVVRPTCDGNLICTPSLFTCPANTECAGGDCVPCARAGATCGDPACEGNDPVRFVCSEALQCEAVVGACEEGTICDEGACRELEPGECLEPGAECAPRACEGNAVLDFRCDADLRCSPTGLPCPPNQICEAGACRALEPGECLEEGAVCAPRACEGNAVLDFRCDADLRCSPTGLPCPPNQICEAGACRALEPGECLEPGAPCAEDACQGNTTRVIFRCDAELVCQPNGLPCPRGEVCDAGACRSPVPGECAEPGTFCGAPVCDGDTVVRPVCNGDLECVQSLFTCPGGTVCEAGECVEAGGGGECACSTPGASVGPSPDGCGFEDANECSGWQSVIIGSENGGFSPEEEEEALNRVVPDGTVFCAFGCCMQISCP